MNLEKAFMILLGFTTGVLGWFSRSLWVAVQKLKEDIAKLEVKIGTDYVRYDSLQDALKPVLEAHTEVKQSLTSKQDKL